MSSGTRSQLRIIRSLTIEHKRLRPVNATFMPLIQGTSFVTGTSYPKESSARRMLVALYTYIEPAPVPTVW